MFMLPWSIQWVLPTSRQWKRVPRACSCLNFWILIHFIYVKMITIQNVNEFWVVDFCWNTANALRRVRDRRMDKAGCRVVCTRQKKRTKRKKKKERWTSVMLVKNCKPNRSNSLLIDTTKRPTICTKRSNAELHYRCGRVDRGIQPPSIHTHTH